VKQRPPILARCSTPCWRNSAFFQIFFAFVRLVPPHLAVFCRSMKRTPKRSMQKRASASPLRSPGSTVATIALSAHTYIGTNLAKLTADDAALNRKASSTDAKAAVAVRFAAKVVERRGHVSDDDIGAVKAAGYSEAQVIEIISLVAENVLTNFVNNVAQTEIDFPALRASQAA
jgi:hypothetical protein